MRKIEPHVVSRVLEDYLAGVKVEAIAHQYGIHHSTVSKLAKKRGIAVRTNRGIVKIKVDRMRSRNRLHRDKLEEFEAWAKSVGYVSEQTKGAYEVLRLRCAILRVAPLVYYERASDASGQGDGSTHITAHGAGDALLSRWFRERNTTKGT